MDVSRLWIALILTGASIWGADLRAQFEKLKTEGRAAVAAEDWAIAEQRYRALLAMSDSLKPSASELYADVVSPLADVYRKTQARDKLEVLLQMRVDRAVPGLAKGLAQADLGFFYQGSDFASADVLHGERFVEAAVRTFEQCAQSTTEGDACRRRLADTAGIQGAVLFERKDYDRAEPMFRRVLTSPESVVQDEVMLVSLHALRGILILRNDMEGARQLELRAAAFEAAHPNVLNRLKSEKTRSRRR